MLPTPSSRLGMGHPSPYPTPLGAFGASMLAPSAPRSSCPPDTKSWRHHWNSPPLFKVKLRLWSARISCCMRRGWRVSVDSAAGLHVRDVLFRHEPMHGVHRRSDDVRRRQRVLSAQPIMHRRLLHAHAQIRTGQPRTRHFPPLLSVSLVQSAGTLYQPI